MTKKLYTRAEAAARIGVRPRTLAEWAYLKKGPPYIKVGHLAKYDPDALDAWLKEKTVINEAA